MNLTFEIVIQMVNVHDDDDVRALSLLTWSQMLIDSRRKWEEESFCQTPFFWCVIFETFSIKTAQVSMSVKKQ